MSCCEWRDGDRVAYDENHGTVERDMTPIEGGSPRYLVRWDQAERTVVWGSDLTEIEED